MSDVTLRFYNLLNIVIFRLFRVTNFELQNENGSENDRVIYTKKLQGETGFSMIPQSIFLFARLTLDNLLKNAEFQPFDAPRGIIFLKF